MLVGLCMPPFGGGDVAGPWTPYLLPSVRAWLAGDDLTGASASFVSLWNDRTTYNNDGVSLSDGTSPKLELSGLNGMNVVRVDGNSGDGVFDTLTFPVNAFVGLPAGSAFVVLKSDFDPSPTSDRGGFLRLGSHTQSEVYPYVDGLIYCGWASTTRKATPNPTPPLTNWHIASAHSAASDWRFYLNASLLYSTTTNTVGWHTDAILCANSGSQGWNGYIAEVIICESELITADRQKVEGYLAHKWGLTSELPVGHPYKSVAP